MDERLEPLLIDTEYEERQQLTFERAVQDLVHNIHKDVQDIAQRAIVYRSDLFYDMFPIQTTGSRKRRVDPIDTWCIPFSHPINRLMNNILQKVPIEHLDVKMFSDSIVFWADDDMQDTVDYIIEQCKRYNLDIYNQTNTNTNTNTTSLQPKKSNGIEIVEDFTSTPPSPIEMFTPPPPPPKTVNTNGYTTITIDTNNKKYS